MVEAGETDTGVPLKLPGIHEYVVPETLFVAVREDEVPLHIEAGEADVVITKSGFIDTDKVAVPVHPEAVPVTV